MSLDTDSMQRSAVPWKVLGAGLITVRQVEDPSIPTTEAATAQRQGRSLRRSVLALSTAPPP